jgi:hypothetical protein
MRTSQHIHTCLSFSLTHTYTTHKKLSLTSTYTQVAVWLTKATGVKSDDNTNFDCVATNDDHRTKFFGCWRREGASVGLPFM